MATKIVTPPAAEPLLLADVKSWLRVEHGDDDTLINDLIATARTTCEEKLGRALITQTWQLFLDRWPQRSRVKNESWWDGVKEGPITLADEGRDFIEIPRPPLQSITHVKAHLEDGTETTLASTKYFVDLASEPGRVILNLGESWPTGTLRRGNGVEVQFVAGYGAAGTNVPEDLKRGMRIAIAAWYDSRAVGQIPAGSLSAWGNKRIERLDKLN